MRIPIDPDARRCSDCLRPEPEVTLPPRSSHQAVLCETCRESRKLEKIQEEQSQQLHRMVKTALRYDDDLQNFRQMVSEIGRNLPEDSGGLIKVMVQDFNRLRSNFTESQGRSQGKLLLDFYKFFMGMIKVALEERQAQDDVSSWSDAELQDACQRYVQSYVRVLSVDDDPADA